MYKLQEASFEVLSYSPVTYDVSGITFGYEDHLFQTHLRKICAELWTSLASFNTRSTINQILPNSDQKNC